MIPRCLVRPRIIAGILLAACLGFPCTDCGAQFEAAQLRSLSRAGGQTGSTFDLQVKTGTHLDEVASLVFSNQRITADLKTTEPLPFSDQRLPKFGEFTVSVPQDLAPGRYEVRTQGRHGLSNPRAFLISPFRNEQPASISRDPAKPTPLPLRTLMLSKATSSEVQFFGIRIEEDHPLQIEVFAQRLDSRLIGQLKLFTPEGREIATARGGDDLDPILHTPADLPTGNYVLAVHDFLYLGGDEYHYQLLARDTDEARSPIQADFTSSEQPPDGKLPAVWTTRSFSRSDRSLLSEPREQTPDGEMVIPYTATHRFPSDATDMQFDFKADKGAAMLIEIVSQRAGEPTDARARLQRVEALESGDLKFHDVANADDSQALSDGAMNLHTTDPIINFVAPVTGDYRLSVRDLDIGNSLRRNQSYTVEVRPAKPSFDLIAYRVYPNKDINQTRSFGSNLFRGGVELVRVFVNRREGFNGPVFLTCEGLPDGTSASESVIAAGQTQSQIAIVATEDATASTTPIRIIGRNEDGSLKAEASAATVQWAKGGGRDFVRTRLCTAISVSVSDRDVAPISIAPIPVAPGTESALETKPETSIKLPFKLTRREGGAAACTIRAPDLPPGITAADLTIAADKSEGEMELKVQKAAKPGSYSLWFQVETKIKYKPNPQALERSQAYREQLQKLHDDPANADRLDAIKDAISEADKQVEAAKKVAQSKEMTVFLPTPNATLRVLNP